MNAETLTTHFQSLCEKRELAALNCVNAIQFVLSVFEAQEFEKSRTCLEDALDLYKQADQRITEFHVQNANQSAQGESHDGNRTAA